MNQILNLWYELINDMLTFLKSLSVQKLSEKMSHLLKFPSKNDQIMWNRVQCVEKKILCDINPFLCVKKLFPSDIPLFFFYLCSKGGQNIFSLKYIKGAKIPKSETQKKTKMNWNWRFYYLNELKLCWKMLQHH